MLTAYNDKQERVMAQHAQKDMHYYCPMCKESVILKQGCKNIAHFAHGRHSQHHGAGETALHYQLKEHIFHALSSCYDDVQLEPYLSDIQQIPDIVVGQYAIEIQLSPIAVTQMRQRTEGLAYAGYRVIWLTLLPKYRQGCYYLTQLQQACIVPERRVMYGVHPTTRQLYRLDHMMSLSARQFVGNCESLSYAELLVDDDSGHTEMSTVRKLATTRIFQYLMACRRQNSVHEPTLSTMYQLRLTDEQVVQLTGYIFPEQLYVYTHPVQWQLKVFEALMRQYNPYHALESCVKVRQFATGSVSRKQIIRQLVLRYRKILKL